MLYFNVLYVYGHNYITSVCGVIITLVHLVDTFKVNIEISNTIFTTLIFYCTND